MNPPSRGIGNQIHWKGKVELLAFNLGKHFHNRKQKPQSHFKANVQFNIGRHGGGISERGWGFFNSDVGLWSQMKYTQLQ